MNFRDLYTFWRERLWSSDDSGSALNAGVVISAETTPNLEYRVTDGEGNPVPVTFRPVPDFYAPDERFGNRA
ncbi:MAG TPA: hypothetical protein VI893_02680 [Thermoplasmata archaeon]|nr:hypothetical protein [Thermoplasmata archaeon]